MQQPMQQPIQQPALQTQAPPPPPPQYHYDYYYNHGYHYRPPPFYGEREPYYTEQPQQQRRMPARELAPYPPLLPIRSKLSDEELMDKFEEWLLGRIIGSSRQEIYRHVLELARQQWFTVSQLKLKDSIETLKLKGALAEIVALLLKQALEFIKDINAVSAL